MGIDFRARTDQASEDVLLVVSAMRLSSWFLCQTLRLLPEASHPARIRLLFRVARTARKRGVGFVRRAQREPLQPLEVLGVELAWVSWGSSSYSAIP